MKTNAYHLNNGKTLVISTELRGNTLTVIYTVYGKNDDVIANWTDKNPLADSIMAAMK